MQINIDLLSVDEQAVVQTANVQLGLQVFGFGTGQLGLIDDNEVALFGFGRESSFQTKFSELLGQIMRMVADNRTKHNSTLLNWVPLREP